MIEMEMNQMKRKVLSLAMIAALCLTMLPTAGWAADDSVKYIDFDKDGVQIEGAKICDQYSLVTEDDTEWKASSENDGWYVVSGEVTIGKKEAPQRITVSGDVHLILTNNAKLTVNGGISVNAGNSLTIYAQPAEKDETMGSLIVQNVEQNNAGIGGGSSSSGGTITINGGTITTNGGVNSAGIGGGSSSSGGKITINGGNITATGGSNGAGIGGGKNGAGGTIEINGGIINAKADDYSGAGIGSGAHGSTETDEKTINITGGSVSATGGSGTSAGGGAGIGSGGASKIGSLVKITISGGTVTAQGGSPTSTSGSSGGAGIGSGGYPAGSSTITISGGTVTASGGKGADGIGNGGESQNGSSSTFSTGDAGNSLIYATAGEGTDTEAIVGSSSPTDWDAIVFTPGENGSAANSGTVYGDVSLANDLTIESDQSLEIPDGTSLEIPEKVMLKIEEGGTLTIHGELVVYGTLTGYSGDSSKIHQQSQSDTDWHTDATHHWHACAYENCTEHKFGEAAHSFTNGKCAVCDYVQPVSITEQPTDVSVTEGESATFSVAATGGGTLSFQWQQSTYNGSNWTNIDGATNASYTIEKTTLDMNGTKYRCVVKNDADSEATSNEVVLTVNEATEEPDPGTDPDEPSTDPDDPSTEPDDPAEEDPSDNPSTPVIPSEPDPEIEVTEPAHGDVEISPAKPEARETVTITPTPDAGYEVEDVIVTDEDGEGVPVTENPDGSWSYEQPESDVTIEVIFGEVAPEPTVDVSEIFLDVDPDAWYKDAVQFAYDNGLMTGTSATEFAPDVTTTRAMIVSILARLEGVTAADDAGFTDVDDEWFATAVNWAASVGVVNGFEDNTFRPNDAITREQLAAILCNYAAWKGEDVSARAELSRYSDAAAISSWATDVMGWAVAEKLISGVTTDELQPQGAATRAQVVAILQRFLSK